MAEILTIHGSGVVAPGEVYEDVVSALEELLAKAKDGSLLGIAYATVSDQGGIGTGWMAAAGKRNHLGVATSLLQHRYYTNLLGDA